MRSVGRLWDEHGPLAGGRSANGARTHAQGPAGLTEWGWGRHRRWRRHGRDSGGGRRGQPMVGGRQLQAGRARYRARGRGSCGSAAAAASGCRRRRQRGQGRRRDGRGRRGRRGRRAGRGQRASRRPRLPQELLVVLDLGGHRRSGTRRRQRQTVHATSQRPVSSCVRLAFSSSFLKHARSRLCLLRCPHPAAFSSFVLAVCKGRSRHPIPGSAPSASSSSSSFLLPPLPPSSASPSSSSSSSSSPSFSALWSTSPLAER